MELNDVVIAQGASTNSNYASQFNLTGSIAPLADFELLMKAVQSAQELDVRIRVGNILSSDVFYNSDSSFNDKWKSMGVLAVEMEAAGLYLNASKLSKKALCITTISDHLYKSEQLSPQERQTGFNNMINIALETAVKSL